MKPKRIQRRRTKGWRMPENAVYVGRGTKWGNPFKVGGNCTRLMGGYFICEDANHAVELYRERRIPILRYHLNELKGKNLACWCRLDQPCHADVLLELANKEINNNDA